MWMVCVVMCLIFVFLCSEVMLSCELCCVEVYEEIVICRNGFFGRRSVVYCCFVNLFN